jgi:23S rRNA pseudouridine2605 synthase
LSERIQKLLASAGVASRRAIEEWIAEGRITVNGRPAELGQRVGAEDHVRVDGRRIALSRKPDAVRVLLYRKRVGEVVTRDDPEGRRTIFRKLPALENGRWIAVGRLDLNTSGLLLLTNSGELARRLMHPSFEIPREYAVRVLGTLDETARLALLNGVRLDDGLAKFDAIAPGQNEDGSGANQWWQVRISEGRHREVRRLFESQNLQVSRLIRVAYGPIELGRGIKTGSYREATPAELKALLAAVQLEALMPVAPRTTRQRGRVSEALAEDRALPARRSPRTGGVRAARPDKNTRERMAGQPEGRGGRARKPAGAGTPPARAPRRPSKPRSR